MAAIELIDYDLSDSSSLRPLPAREQHALPPTDTGPQAWLCLAGCFTANALIWGFAFSFGLLQEYYRSHAPFSAEPNGIAAIGTTATGLMYLTMPVYFAVFQRWSRLRRISSAVSVPLIAVSLVSASFAQTVPQLVATQGLMYALAGNAIVTPTVSYVDEWFVRRKGTAFGIMIAGDGVGGVLMPLIMQPLLERCGFRWTLRIIALIMVVLITPLLFFLKPRLPVSSTQAFRPIDMTFIKSPLFWVLQTFNMIQGLGYFLPINYLPSIMQSLGGNPTLGSITILLVNLGSIVGCLLVGVLNDRLDVTTILLGIALSSSSAVFLVMGFSESIISLTIFSLLYGLTASAYSTSWSGMIKDLQRFYEGTDTTIVFGLLAAGKGVGSVISGPLSEAFVNGAQLSQSMVHSAYGTQYGSIILFSGCTALAGGSSWLFRRAGLI